MADFPRERVTKHPSSRDQQALEGCSGKVCVSSRGAEEDVGEVLRSWLKRREPLFWKGASLFRQRSRRYLSVGRTRCICRLAAPVGASLPLRFLKQGKREPAWKGIDNTLVASVARREDILKRREQGGMPRCSGAATRGCLPRGWVRGALNLLPCLLRANVPNTHVLKEQVEIFFPVYWANEACFWPKNNILLFFCHLFLMYCVC